MKEILGLGVPVLSHVTKFVLDTTLGLVEGTSWATQCQHHDRLRGNYSTCHLHPGCILNVKGGNAGDPMESAVKKTTPAWTGRAKNHFK